MSAKRWSGVGRVDVNSYYKWINIRIRKKANISSSILRANTAKNIQCRNEKIDLL